MLKFHANPDLARLLLKEILTPREVEVFIELAEHKIHKIGAANLGIAQVTFYQHTQAIYKKLDLGNQTQLIMFAYINGVIKVSDAK